MLADRPACGVYSCSSTESHATCSRRRPCRRIRQCRVISGDYIGRRGLCRIAMLDVDIMRLRIDTALHDADILVDLARDRKRAKRRTVDIGFVGFRNDQRVLWRATSRPRKRRAPLEVFL